LDAEILADVYLAMTGGQTALQLSDNGGDGSDGLVQGERIIRLPPDRKPLPVIRASLEDIAAHEAQLDVIASSSGGKVLWRDLAERELAEH
jgi:DNA polymerase-3 subunit epsilon